MEAREQLQDSLFEYEEENILKNLPSNIAMFIEQDQMEKFAYFFNKADLHADGAGYLAVSQTNVP